MKIKSLLLLGLMAIFSMNAFAITTTWTSGGIKYNVIGTADETAHTANVTVAAIFDNTNGNAIKTAKQVTIGKTVTAIVDDETWTLTVKSFTSGWVSAALDCSDMTTLTVDNSIDLTNALGTTTIVTLNITGEIAADYAIGTLPAAKTQLTALDLSKLTGSKKLTVPAGLTGLKTITLPSAVDTEIAANAFQNNTNLEGISLANVSKIGANAFDGCTNDKFTTLAIPASIVKDGIGANAFKGMTKLETVTITNEKLETLGKWFDGCTALKSVTVSSKSITGMAKSAFDGCTSLETAVMPAGLQEIPYKAFAGCTALKVFRVKSAVKRIGASAFSGCTALETVKFADANALEEIDANAFKGCPFTTLDLTGATKLASVTATSFPANAYTSVLLAGTALATVDPAYDGFSAPFAIILGGSKASLTEITLPSELTSIADDLFKGFTALESIGLPKGLETIGENAFRGSGLKGIKIKNKVKTIKAFAFEGCKALTNVNLSEADALETIDNGAFANLYDGTSETGLTSIAIPAKVQTIGASAFKGNKALETADFSAAAELTTIKANAFAGCDKLNAIDMSGAAKLATIDATSFPAAYYTSIKLAGTAITDLTPVKGWMNETADAEGNSVKTTLKEFTFPTGVTTIPDDFFKGYTALKSVSLPKECTTIGASAFQGSGLTALKIRNKVKTIGTLAFQGCANLPAVNFSEATALETIGGGAFSATAITAVEIPANADDAKTLTIGNKAFKNCAALESFKAASWAGTLANNLFEGCEKLASVTVTEGIDAIGTEAFMGCKALAALDLSTTQLVALNQADIFKGCTALAEITFPETLTALGDGAGTADGLFAACPIENLDASNVILSDNLFGEYYDADLDANVARDADHANTTLKTVKIGGEIPANCFAYCTALESVEYFDDGTDTGSNVAAYAFEHCTGLKTFTMEPEVAISAIVVDEDAFHGCIPFVKFVTNTKYIDYVVAWYGKVLAPTNATFGEAGVTIVKTVVDKKNANQAFAKFYNETYNVRFNAEDCKIFTAYADGETVYFQACRTYDGEYHIPSGVPVIIKTTEAKEVSYEIWAWRNSIGWNDLYCSQEGDDLADVQDSMHPDYNASPFTYLGLSAGEYLYRLTNTADQGFGFTFFSGTTIKEGQFFIACEKKPEGAGRLNAIWLDEDGNVIDGDATAIQNVKKSLDQNDGAIYNLQGVRVQKAQKGLYIQNGKKIFVK